VTVSRPIDGGHEIFSTEEEMTSALKACRELRARMMAGGAILSRQQAQGVGRNDLCPCGSGVKFKKCHLDATRGA
jgi:uncharacterized protein YecA (UPF0149 family)